MQFAVRAIQSTRLSLAQMLFLLLTVAFPLRAAEQWNHPLVRSPVPGLQHGTFQSGAMNVEVGYNIYLPPEYETNAASRFPVVYYLHGFDGDEGSYVNYAKMLDNDIRQGKVAPMILVLANGGKSSFFCDTPGGKVKAETCLISELLPEIDRKFRTVASREGRSLHGYSMGGFGALKLAFKYPELFGSVVAYGAVLPTAPELRKRSPRMFEQTFNNSDATFDENNPLRLAEQNANKIRGQLAIQIVLGSDDETLEINRRLHQLLAGLNIPHEYIEIPGVPHAKEPLYAKAALAAFRFSAQPPASAPK